MLSGNQEVLIVSSSCTLLMPVFFLLSYLCYVIAQLPVEVSSGIGDDHDTQRHHRTPTMRHSCSD